MLTTFDMSIQLFNSLLISNETIGKVFGEDLVWLGETASIPPRKVPLLFLGTWAILLDPK